MLPLPNPFPRRSSLPDPLSLPGCHFALPASTLPLPGSKTAFMIAKSFHKKNTHFLSTTRWIYIRGLFFVHCFVVDITVMLAFIGTRFFNVLNKPIANIRSEANL